MRERLAVSEIERAREMAARIAHADPRRIAGVAARCGISRPAASMFISRKYAVGGKQVDESGVARKVLAALDNFVCPHTQQQITPDACRRRALGPKPFGGSAKLAHWTACQQCPGKPQEA